MSLLAVLAIVALGLALVAGVGALVLVKLGVITHYALKQEPPETGEYGLDQSREAGPS